jgi:hypothetical protein
MIIRKLLVLFVTLCPLHSIGATASSTVRSMDDLPPAYHHLMTRSASGYQIDLDRLNHLEKVDEERLDSWSLENLNKGNFLIVQGINFLEHTYEGFYGRWKDRFEPLESIAVPDDSKPYMFSGFWEPIWASASLVNPSKYPTAGSYGVVLDIPPPLIVATYQLDSTTLTHSDIFGKDARDPIPDETDLTDHIKKYMLEYPGCYNSEMFCYRDDEGNVQSGSKRIYAEGETDDSPAFMTPNEMITRGRPKEHNEIKYVPRGRYKGEDYAVGIKGIWYVDKPSGEGMMRKEPLDSSRLAQLNLIARQLNIDLVPISQEDHS